MPPGAGYRGFTLIEMLVVLMIMGLFVGLVSTIVQPDERALLRVEAERLAQLLDLAATNSRLTGNRIAWSVDGPGYRFWRFSEGGHWLPILDDDSLRARELPQGMTVSAVSIERMHSTESMLLEFHPHAPAKVFSIDMRFGAARETVTGSPVGEVRVLSVNEENHDEPAQR